MTKIIGSLVGEKTDAIHYATCLFRFLTLLQWPRDAKRADAVARIMLARYVSDKFVSLTGPAQSEYTHVFLQHANPNSILQECMSDYTFDALTDCYEHDNQRLVAAIVRFLISFESESEDSRNQPSLRKAFHLLQYGELYSEPACSWKTFSEAWASYKDVGVFLCSRQYGRGKRFILDPRAADFPSQAQSLLNDVAGIEIYFSHAKWAAERLNRVLDGRAKKKMRIAAFPAKLQPTSFPLARPTSRMIELIASYRSEFA